MNKSSGTEGRNRGAPGVVHNTQDDNFPTRGGLSGDLFKITLKSSVFKEQNSSGTGDSDNLYSKDINPVSTKPNNGYENSGKDVLEFLEEMKLMGVKANLSPKRLAEILPRYCTPDIGDRIRRSPVYHLGSWKQLKQFIVEAFRIDVSRKLTENDLDVIIKKVWNVRTASMLLEEYVAVGNNLISASKCDEDKEVAKLSSVLSPQVLKSGFIEQGKQRITNEFITIKEAAMYIKRIYLNEQLYDFLEDANIVNSKESGHGKRECQELTKDFKDGLVLFDSQGKILNKNSEVITPNYGRGGMVVIVRNPENKKKIWFCKIENLNLKSNQENEETDYGKYDIFNVKRNRNLSETLDGTSSPYGTEIQIKQLALMNNEFRKNLGDVLKRKKLPVYGHKGKKDEQTVSTLYG
ncbi:hypothetical protein BB559_006223, partial [Furculomyces boomerangus]